MEQVTACNVVRRAYMEQVTACNVRGAYMEQVMASNVVRGAYVEQVTASISQPAVVWCGVVWYGARVPIGTGPVVWCGSPTWNR